MPGQATSISLSQSDLDLLHDMCIRSGWKRGQIMSTGIRFLHQTFFSDAEVDVNKLVQIWRQKN